MRRSAAPGTASQLRQQCVGKRAVSVTLTHDLHVERRRQTEIEDLIDDVGGQERERDAGKLLRAVARAACVRIARWDGGPARSEIMMSASPGPIGAEVL